MKKITILIFIIFISINISAQNIMDQAYNNIYWAMILQKQNNHKEALNYFDEAFKLAFIEDSTYLIDAAYSAFKIGSNKKAEYYLSEAISKYNVPHTFISENYKLKDYANSETIKAVITNYNKLKGEFYKNLPNVDEYIEIEKMRETDQFVRKFPEMKTNNATDKKILEDYSVYVRDHTDSLNSKKLMDLTKKMDILEMVTSSYGIKD